MTWDMFLLLDAILGHETLVNSAFSSFRGLVSWLCLAEEEEECEETESDVADARARSNGLRPSVSATRRESCVRRET